MRGRAALVVTVAALAVVGVGRTDLAQVPQAVFGPAYDTVTQASLRNLGVALQSYGMFDGGFEALDVEDLAGWGWVPSGTTAVTIWTDGDGFRAVAKDVRPGSTAFEVSSVDGEAVQVARVDADDPAAQVLPADAGVHVEVAADL